ncbi:MAG: matrixin family metalloprotease [Bacteroidetes bacterium]|nr:matrixin family metalloprotease [Bacteroidota bacterium]MBS1756160.1 matrixin family metalloprotease [Bacteroidota bacterium]
MKNFKILLLLPAIIFYNNLIAQIPVNIKKTQPIIKNMSATNVFKFYPGKKIIKLASTLKSLDIDKATINTNNSRIQLLDPCADSRVNCESQVWNIVAIPGKSNQYFIQLLSNGKCLTVNPFNTNQLSFINKIDKNGSIYQSWTISPLNDNKYQIKATVPVSGSNITKVLTSTGNTSRSEVGIQNECTTANCENQAWTFYNIEEQPHACFAYQMPPRPVAPTCINCQVGVTTENLIAKTSNMWTPGTTLRVRIDGGSPFIRSKVIQYANEWTSYANIHFNFIQSGDAEVIVTFGNDGQSYSFVGKDCIDPGRRFIGNFTQTGTTHFGWFTDDTPEDEFRAVILHEFGHVLGFVHEQSHPDAAIPWDKPKVYAFYAGPPNYWDHAKVDAQVFAVASRGETQYSSYDRTSIMQYAISNDLTIGDFEIPENTSLSPTDKAFARLMYPPGNITGNKLSITVNTGGDDVRQNSNVLIYLKLNSTALPEFRKSLNNNQGWGNNSSHTTEIEIPAGIAITDIQECKILFTSGKQFETDTPDNWNLDKLVIDWVTPDGYRTNLVNRSGSPYIRFYNTGESLLFRR